MSYTGGSTNASDESTNGSANARTDARADGSSRPGTARTSDCSCSVARRPLSEFFPGNLTAAKSYRVRYTNAAEAVIALVDAIRERILRDATPVLRDCCIATPVTIVLHAVFPACAPDIFKACAAVAPLPLADT